MTEQLGFNVFYYDGSWHLANISNDVYDEPMDIINGATEAKARIEYPQFSAYGTMDKAWVGADTAKLLAYTDVGVTEEDMDADFDAVTKFFYGRIYAVEHHANYIIVKAKQLLGKWLFEPVQTASNVASSSTVTARSASTITLAAEDGIADNRGLRVTYVNSATSQATKTHTHVASPTEFTDSGLGSLNIYGNDADMNTDDANSFSHREYHATAAVNVYLTLKFNPASAPPQIPASIVVKTCFFYNDVTSWVIAPTIKLYNYATSTWVTVWAETRTGASPGLETHTFTITRDYYNATDNEVKIRSDGGRANIAAGKQSTVYMQYAALYSTPNNHHVALEYKIASSSGAVITVEGANPVEDLVNVGDMVDIIYTEKEFLEDDASYGLAQAKYDDLVNSISFVPTTIKPTYSLFRWSLINNYAAMVNRRNGTFFYPTRKTTSGKFDVYFRATGVDNGLTITPDEFDGDDFSNAFNRDDKCRAAVVQNKQTWAARSSEGDHTEGTPGAFPTNDLQIIVLNMPELPDNYLLDYATAVYNYRNALGDDIIIPIRDVLINEIIGYTEVEETVKTDEDFDAYTVGNSIIGGQWSWVIGPAGTDSMKCAAGKVGRFICGGAGRTQVLYMFSAASASSPAAGWYVETKVTAPSGGASNGIDMFVKEASTGPIVAVVFRVDGHVWIYNNTTWTDTGKAYTGGVQYVLKVVGITATTSEIFIDGVSIGTYTNYNNVSTSGKVIDSIALDTYNYLTTGNYATQVDLDDIKASWITEETGGDPIYEDVPYEVRDAADDVLHVGASIHVHAAPTTKGGVDYQVDDDFLIRNIKWTKDRQAILFLGAAIATAQSPEQMLDEILSRHDHASTS